jgi:hypothetical protein
MEYSVAFMLQLVMFPSASVLNPKYEVTVFDESRVIKPSVNEKLVGSMT